MPAPGKAMVGAVGNFSVSKSEFSCRSSAANYKADEVRQAGWGGGATWFSKGYVAGE